MLLLLITILWNLSILCWNDIISQITFCLLAVVDTLFPWFCKRNFVNNAVPTQWHYRIHLFSGQTTKQARYLIFRQTNKVVKFTILFIWWISMFASFRLQIWLRKVRFGKRKVFTTQLWWTLKIWPYLFELPRRHSFKQHADKSMQFKDVYLSRLSCVKKVSQSVKLPDARKHVSSLR